MVNANNDIGALYSETQTVSGVVSGISAGESVEIRIYLADNSTSAVRWHRLDNIQVNAVFVPEPSGALLFGLGMTVLGLRPRRRERLP